MADDLVIWLRGVLDDEERIARAAYGAGGTWTAHNVIRFWRKDYRQSVVAEHVARQDPAATLARVEAHRSILGIVGDVLVDPSFAMDVHDVAVSTLRALAAAYAHLPGYRAEEWAP